MMKKLVFLMLMVLVTLFSVTAFAAPTEKPNVVVMYLNNAKTNLIKILIKVYYQR